MKPQTMPGEESGAGRRKAPDLYRLNGSLPIANHTMQGVADSIEERIAQMDETNWRQVEILLKNQLSRLRSFCRSRHSVIAELYVAEF
jgi:hypothetical protein